MKISLRFLFRLVPLFLSIIFARSPYAAGGMERTPVLPFVRAVYGFSSTAEPFKSVPKDSLPEWLRGYGVNAVFVSPNEKPEILAILREANILCLQEFTVFAGRSLYRENPKWRPIGSDGKEIEPDGWYHGLSPNQPGLRQKRLDDFRKRLKNPHIQGIWLDFIRYAVRWEKPKVILIDNCFSASALSQFERFAKVRLPESASTSDKADFIYANHKDAWIDFKVHTIRSWVEEARRIRDRERPGVWLGLFGLPWTPSDRDGAIRRIAGQDYRKLADSVDVFSPMVYHRLCGKKPAWIGDVARSVLERTNKPVWPIVQATGEPGKMDGAEFERAVLEGAEASKTGVILFTASHIQNEKRWPQVKSVFHKIQSQTK